MVVVVVSNNITFVKHVVFHWVLSAPSNLISTHVALLTVQEIDPSFCKSSFFVQTLSISAVEFMRARGNRNFDQTGIDIRGLTKFLEIRRVA